MRTLDMNAIHARLVAAGLERYADNLLAQVEPSVRLTSRPAREEELTLGGTRLGGQPDVPARFRWPAFQGVPCSFVAQLDLGSLVGLAGVEALPPAGLLSFFYDAEQRPWGFDPREREGWRVLYTPPGAPLARAPFPAKLPKASRFRPCPLTARADFTFAPWESADIAALGLDLDQGVSYAEALGDPDVPAGTHRLLGHPDPVQGDMQLEAQLAFHGVSCGDGFREDDERIEELRPGATSWRLLLQVDTDDNAGMMWGDAGRIYFWMRRDDLRARRFENSWLVLQCH